MYVLPLTSLAPIVNHRYTTTPDTMSRAFAFSATAADLVTRCAPPKVQPTRPVSVGRLMLRSCRIIAMTFVVAACGGSVSEPPAGTPIPLTRLSANPYSLTCCSAIAQSERRVVRDNATWQTVWTETWRGTSPTPALPSVDFTKEMLIVAALGSRSTGGYGIVVDSALMTSSGLTVWIGTSSPGARCITTQAFTSPVDIARVQRIDAPVGFVDVPRVVQC
jgi:protease stability complex PrcB-like protein